MANTRAKKITKHSKKFERTQTGCLQCRQKKWVLIQKLRIIKTLTNIFERKKCDGKRPSCESCIKRGISCYFPANIRIFQYQKKQNKEFVSEPTPKSVAKSDADSKIEPINFKQVKLEHPTCNTEQDKRPPSVDDELKENLLSLSDKIEQILEVKEEPDIESIQLQSRSDSIASLISDSDNDSIISMNQPRTPPSTSTYEISESQRATNLIHEGGSISKILNQMTIDLIKKSINNLQYIDFEKKRDLSILQAQDILEEEQYNKSLGYIDEVMPDELIFHPDEYLSFD